MEKFNRPGVVVYDRVTGRWGAVKKLHAPGEYVSPVNELPVDAPVLELDTGDSFIANAGEEGRFVELDNDEHDFLVHTARTLSQAVLSISARAAAKLPRELALRMMANELRSIASTVEASIGK